MTVDWEPLCSGLDASSVARFADLFQPVPNGVLSHIDALGNAAR